MTKYAALEGLTFDRAQTATATAAKVRTLKERRAAIVDRLYTRTEFNLTRLEAESFETLVRGEGGAEHVDTLDFVPPEHERALVATIQTALSAAAKLELQDGDQKADDASRCSGTSLQRCRPSPTTNSYAPARLARILSRRAGSWNTSVRTDAISARISSESIGAGATSMSPCAMSLPANRTS